MPAPESEPRLSRLRRVQGLLDQARQELRDLALPENLDLAARVRINEAATRLASAEILLKAQAGGKRAA